jgi:hypothetical protein
VRRLSSSSNRVAVGIDAHRRVRVEIARTRGLVKQNARGREYWQLNYRPDYFYTARSAEPFDQHAFPRNIRFLASHLEESQ